MKLKLKNNDLAKISEKDNKHIRHRAVKGAVRRTLRNAERRTADPWNR